MASKEVTLWTCDECGAHAVGDEDGAPGWVMIVEGPPDGTQLCHEFHSRECLMEWLARAASDVEAGPVATPAGATLPASAAPDQPLVD